MQITSVEESTEYLPGEQPLLSLFDSELCLRPWVDNTAHISSDMGLVYDWQRVSFVLDLNLFSILGDLHPCSDQHFVGWSFLGRHLLSWRNPVGRNRMSSSVASIFLF